MKNRSLKCLKYLKFLPNFVADANITFGYDLRIFQNLFDIKYYTLRHVDIETRNWNACNSIDEPWKLRIIQSLLLRYLFSYWFNTYGYNISGFSIPKFSVSINLCNSVPLSCIRKFMLYNKLILFVEDGS